MFFLAIVEELSPSSFVSLSLSQLQHLFCIIISYLRIYLLYRYNHSKHLFGLFYTPGTVLTLLCILIHVILTKTPWDKYSYYLRFIKEETEAKRLNVW